MLEIPEHNKLLPVFRIIEVSTLLPPPNLAYNPQITNNSSQVTPPIHQTVQIPKRVCILLNEDAEKQDEEHLMDEETKYPDITCRDHG